MSDGLLAFLWPAGIGLVIGLAIAAVAVWRFPQACKQYGNACLKLRWGWFGLFAIVFAGLAALNLSRPYFAIFFAAFALFELVAMIAALIRQRSPIEPTA